MYNYTEILYKYLFFFISDGIKNEPCAKLCKSYQETSLKADGIHI